MPHHHLACVWACPGVSLSSAPCREICHLPPRPGELSTLQDGTVSLHHRRDRVCGESWQPGGWDLHRLRWCLSHQCISPLTSNQSPSALSVLGGVEGWVGEDGCFYYVSPKYLFKISSCSVFSSHSPAVSVLLQSVGLMDSHLFQEWHVLSQGTCHPWRCSLYTQITLLPAARERTP